MADEIAQRDQWHELPVSVREAVAEGLGAPVSSAITQRGGFSHGMAAVLVGVDGRTAFAKAVRVEDGLAGPYRTEAAVARSLAGLVATPTMRFTIEEDGWFVVVFDAVEGEHPHFDRPDELRTVLASVARLAVALTPSPVLDIPTVAQRYGSRMRNWNGFAEQRIRQDLTPWAARNLSRLARLEPRWLNFADGPTLLHTDLRPDNLLLSADGTVSVVDWGWPCTGAAWVDLGFLAPAIAAAGTDPDPILAEQSATRDMDPVAMDSLLCALAGYWTAQSHLPAPPRSPGLRSYQARAARTSLAWLESRTGWV
ncbi:phosphotransferase [Nocardia sp. NPDC005366]|uniref:phosphotransferase n=1 Tax=Nocardia sp. NPDC005366 TaxID=3156878 RepID=UPI0033B91DF6